MTLMYNYKFDPIKRYLQDNEGKVVTYSKLLKFASIKTLYLVFFYLRKLGYINKVSPGKYLILKRVEDNLSIRSMRERVYGN
jgi:hypothetical protein